VYLLENPSLINLNTSSIRQSLKDYFQEEPCSKITSSEPPQSLLEVITCIGTDIAMIVAVTAVRKALTTKK